MWRVAGTIALVVALFATVSACSRHRPASGPAATPAPTTAEASPGGTFDRPDLGVRLRWPSGWVQRPSDDFVLLLASAEGLQSTISLDVPKLPPHIPGLIPIGSVRNGYLDDLRKSVGRLRTSDLPSPAVSGAAVRFVRSAWTNDAGQEWQETALLMVHGDRVYILRATGPVPDEPAVRRAFDEIARSLEWTRK